MTILIAGGDSFTYGNELSDCTSDRASMNTWSSLLANKLDMSYDCTAWGGDGNSAIARKIMTACSKHLSQGHDIVVAVMWSYPSRYEFRFSYDTKEKHSPWYTITPWTHESDTGVITNAFTNFKESIFDHYKNNQKTAQSTGLATFSERFFRDVGDSEYYELYTSVKEMLFLQNWLKQQNIPYIYTYVDTSVFHPNIPVDSYLKCLYDSLDQSCCYSSIEFYKWAKTNDFPFGATHPLEPAHTAFVDKILAFATQKLK